MYPLCWGSPGERVQVRDALGRFIEAPVPSRQLAILYSHVYSHWNGMRRESRDE